MAGVVRLKPSQLKEIAREDIERRRQSTPIAEDDGISFSRQNSRERESLEQLVLRVFEQLDGSSSPSSSVSSVISRAAAEALARGQSLVFPGEEDVESVDGNAKLAIKRYLKEVTDSIFPREREGGESRDSLAWEAVEHIAEAFAVERPQRKEASSFADAFPTRDEPSFLSSEEGEGRGRVEDGDAIRSFLDSEGGATASEPKKSDERAPSLSLSSDARKRDGDEETTKKATKKVPIDLSEEEGHRRSGEGRSSSRQGRETAGESAERRKEYFSVEHVEKRQKRFSSDGGRRARDSAFEEDEGLRRSLAGSVLGPEGDEKEAETAAASSAAVTAATEEKGKGRDRGNGDKTETLLLEILSRLRDAEAQSQERRWREEGRRMESEAVVRERGVLDGEGLKTAVEAIVKAQGEALRVTSEVQLKAMERVVLAIAQTRTEERSDREPETPSRPTAEDAYSSMQKRRRELGVSPTASEKQRARERGEDKKKQKITGDPLLLPSEEDVKEAESTVKRLRKQLSSYLEEARATASHVHGVEQQSRKELLELEKEIAAAMKRHQELRKMREEFEGLQDGSVRGLSSGWTGRKAEREGLEQLRGLVDGLVKERIQLEASLPRDSSASVPLSRPSEEISLRMRIRRAMDSWQREGWTDEDEKEKERAAPSPAEGKGKGGEGEKATREERRETGLGERAAKAPQETRAQPSKTMKEKPSVADRSTVASRLRERAIRGTMEKKVREKKQRDELTKKKERKGPPPTEKKATKDKVSVTPPRATTAASAASAAAASPAEALTAEGVSAIEAVTTTLASSSTSLFDLTHGPLRVFAPSVSTMRFPGEWRGGRRPTGEAKELDRPPRSRRGFGPGEREKGKGRREGGLRKKETEKKEKREEEVAVKRREGPTMSSSRLEMVLGGGREWDAALYPPSEESAEEERYRPEEAEEGEAAISEEESMASPALTPKTPLSAPVEELPGVMAVEGMGEQESRALARRQERDREREVEVPATVANLVDSAVAHISDSLLALLSFAEGREGADAEAIGGGGGRGRRGGREGVEAFATSLEDDDEVLARLLGLEGLGVYSSCRVPVDASQAIAVARELLEREMARQVGRALKENKEEGAEEEGEEEDGRGPASRPRVRVLTDKLREEWAFRGVTDDVLDTLVLELLAHELGEDMVRLRSRERELMRQHRAEVDLSHDLRRRPVLSSTPFQLELKGEEEVVEEEKEKEGEQAFAAPVPPLPLPPQPAAGLPQTSDASTSPLKAPSTRSASVEACLTERESEVESEPEQDEKEENEEEEAVLPRPQTRPAVCSIAIGPSSPRLTAEVGQEAAHAGIREGDRVIASTLRLGFEKEFATMEVQTESRAIAVREQAITTTESLEREGEKAAPQRKEVEKVDASMMTEAIVEEKEEEKEEELPKTEEEEPKEGKTLHFREEEEYLSPRLIRPFPAYQNAFLRPLPREAVEDGDSEEDVLLLQSGAVLSPPETGLRAAIGVSRTPEEEDERLETEERLEERLRLGVAMAWEDEGERQQEPAEKERRRKEALRREREWILAKATSLRASLSSSSSSEGPPVGLSSQLSRVYQRLLGQKTPLDIIGEAEAREIESEESSFAESSRSSTTTSSSPSVPFDERFAMGAPYQYPPEEATTLPIDLPQSVEGSGREGEGVVERLRKLALSGTAVPSGKRREDERLGQEAKARLRSLERSAWAEEREIQRPIGHRALLFFDDGVPEEETQPFAAFSRPAEQRGVTARSPLQLSMSLDSDQGRRALRSSVSSCDAAASPPLSEFHALRRRFASSAALAESLSPTSSASFRERGISARRRDDPFVDSVDLRGAEEGEESGERDTAAQKERKKTGATAVRGTVTPSPAVLESREVVAFATAQEQEREEKEGEKEEVQSVTTERLASFEEREEESDRIFHTIEERSSLETPTNDRLLHLREEVRTTLLSPENG